MLYLKRIWVLLLALLSLFTVVLPQAKENKIILVVEDQTASFVAEAEITLTGADKKEKQFKTDQQGKAALAKLPDGDYLIKISSPGFKNYESGKITLAAGETKSFKVVLEVAPVESSVTVESERGLDANSYGSVTTLNKSDLKDLPNDPAELKRILQLVYGEYGEDLPISVNGIMGANVPPKGRIKQVRINQSVFSAQYETTSSNGIDIVTDSAMDKFEYYGEFNFSDSRFNATNPFLARRVPFQVKRYSFGVAGPLNKKTSFSVDVARSDNDISSVINASVLDPNLQIISLRQSLVNSRRFDDISGSINSDSVKNHKLYVNYEYSINRQKNAGVGGFSLASQANNNRYVDQELSFSDTYTPDPKFFSQTTFVGKSSKSASFSVNNQVAVNVLGAFLGGGSQNNSSASDLSFEFHSDTVKSYERYSLSFGGMVRGRHLRQISRSNFGGTYTFSSRIAPLLDAANNPLTDSAGNVITDQISSIESYRRTLLFRQLGYTGVQIRALGGGADQFTIAGGNPLVEASQYDYALYLQNSYSVAKTFGVSFGLRYENQTNIKSKLNFAPRLGIIWQPKAKEKRSLLVAPPRISAGIGMFYNRFSIDDIILARAASNSDRAFYFITDPNILDSYPDVPSVSSLSQSSSPRSLRLIDSGVQTPVQKTIEITADKKLPKKFSLILRLNHTRTSRQSFLLNVNSPLAGTFNPLNQDSGVYPFSNDAAIYKTFSSGKSIKTRYFISLNFPQELKILKLPTNAGIYYNFTKSRNNVVSGSSSPTDPYDFSQDFAPGTADGLHSLTGLFNVHFPHSVSLTGIFSVQSGTRFNIYTGRDTNGDGFYSERPAFATDPNKPGVINTKYGLLDPNPLPGDRLIPRNLGRGPRNIKSDIFFSKNIGFNEDKRNKQPPRQSLTFGIQIKNAFNINNRSVPIGNISSPYFLRSISVNETGDISNSNPRQINFTTEFRF